MAGKSEPQDHLLSQVNDDSFLEESHHRRATSEKPKRKNSALSPLEVEAMMHLVEKLQREAQKSETDSTAPLLSLVLEVKENKAAKPLLIPVGLKNLYQGMVVLEVNHLEFLKNPETLQGKEAILRLTEPESQESMNIDGTMTWTHSLPDKKINLNLKTQNAQPNKPASKILENSLPTASKDTKMLWNLWDETQATRESVSTEKRSNYILLLLAGGTIASSLIAPPIFSTMQNLLGVMGIEKIIRYIRGK